MAIAYFPMYGSYEEIFETLTDEQLGALVRGGLRYFNSGAREPMNDRGLIPLFAMLCRDIDLSGDAYEEKCAKRRDAARKRWKKGPDGTAEAECDPVQVDADDANASKWMQTDAHACKWMQNKDKVKANTNAITNASAREIPADTPARAEEREDRFAEEDAAALFGVTVPGEEDVTLRGSFSNVPLTDAQLERLHREIPEADEYIDRLSEHIASTGKTYADCCATIFKWVREDRRKAVPKTQTPPDQGSFDTDEFFEAALKRSYRMMEEIEAKEKAKSGG
ncbi:MAG: hypothetical protein II889_03650 [Clostridia bacterium]|nr:hypothetical protein [Clostridia bacterium]